MLVKAPIWTRGSLLAVALLLALACGGDDVELTVAAPPVGLTEFQFDWPQPNYDYANTRATFDSAINSTNVDRLVEAWRYPLPPGGGGAAATTPIIVDGIVYLGDLSTNVHAIDLATGKRLWIADVSSPILGPGGVAVGAGKVFGTKSGRAVAAYDARTGEELWSTDIRTSGGSVDIQPVVANGLVLAATSALRDPGAGGTLYALDAGTGAIVWSFDTIESKDLWGHPEINSGGGAWYPPAVDLEAGVSYWGTSNPYPFPGVEGFPNGSSRPGDNRWTNSILAIDLQTGALRWGHQAIAHDLFDRDAVIAAIVDLTNGEQVIVNTGKLGRVIGLDPEGGVLWDTPVGMHMNDDVESFEGPLVVLPGSLGGVETPIAIADGIVYVTVVNAAARYGGPAQNSGGFDVALGSNSSQLVAIDAATGAIVWDVPIPGDCFGAATVVNDLVFTSVITGKILAFHRATGEQVWSYQAPGGINGWPAVVDDRLVIPVGFGSPPVLLTLALETE